MGASGSAWIKPKKRTGLRPDALLDVAHPEQVRVGQRYFPLAHRGKHRATFQVVKLDPSGARCQGRREDVPGRIASYHVERLLAVESTGAGQHYRFVGWAPRAYRTHALLLSRGDAWARLLLPEWSRRLPVSISSGSLRGLDPAVGDWIACKAELAADSSARVNPRDFSAPKPDFVPPSVDLAPAATKEAVEPTPVPPAGAGCGDCVLFVSEADATAIRHGAGELYVTGHAPPLAPGGRAYLHAGHVLGYRPVARVVPMPSGSKVRFDGRWTDVTVTWNGERPSGGVIGGRYGAQTWTWRAWERADERTG